MRDASRSFAGSTLPQHVATAMGNPTIPADLRSIADAFQELQQARHEADYDLARRFTRREAMRLVQQVESAFKTWKGLRKSVVAKTYLHSLFAWNKWRR
jgi:hypothetical protein